MKDIFFEDIKAQIEASFISQGWVTVYKSFEMGGLYSAIADVDKVDEALKSYDWEIRYGDIRPYIYDEKYCSVNSFDFEPLVLCREELGQYDNYRELSEDFRLYHNLYEVYISPNQKKYLFIDSNGDEEEVAKITESEVVVKLKFLKDYISVKGKHFFIYFDIMRYSPKRLTELSICELNENIKKEDVYFYNHIINDASKNGFDNENKTFSWIMGKVIIRKIKNYQYDGLWGNMEERGKYAEFIIDFDDNGNEVSFICDDKKLGNYFGGNPDAPQYVTPVFFSKDVLKKYYDNPKKYSVEDGCVRCNDVWLLRLDNSCKDYVIVLLGDLGKNLHYKEQLYWKSFNIPPQKGGLSHTAYTRWIEGNFCDPDKPDLY